MSLRLFIAVSLHTLHLYNPTTCSFFVFDLQINCLSFVPSVGNGILFNGCCFIFPYTDFIASGTPAHCVLVSALAGGGVPKDIFCIWR